MPDKEKPPVLPVAKPMTLGKDDGAFHTTAFVANPILPNGKQSTKYDDGYASYTDPFFTGGLERSGEDRMKVIESGLDSVQPWYDKLGNGAVKFAGSFADGILSTAGTIYAIPASIISWDKTKFWDNPFTNLGADISHAVGENFSNYQSLKEQNANAWSPSYWMTLNFFSDNILGNLGYAAAAYVTGGGIAKGLSKLAPYIAGKNLAAGLSIIADGGAEVGKDLSKAYSAVKRWDAAQQGISLGISAAGEASVEALNASTEYKQKEMSDAAAKFGGVDLIPDSVKAGIEAKSKEVGNTVYAVNLPILAGANFIQWGKSISPFRSEFKSFSKNALKLTAKEEFAQYAAKNDVVKKGILGALGRGSVATVGALKSNLTEAAQEGAQFIASEGTKNWYHRKTDPNGWQSTWDYMDPYITAAKDLFTTKEGVSNLLGGFAGGMPFGIQDYIKAISGDPSAQKESENILRQLNNPFTSGTVRENLKTYLQGMARHGSAQRDLQQALIDGDEHGARNAKFDQLKTYINSRIQTGRMDLLQDEIDQISALDENEFKKFFHLEDTDNITKAAVVDRFKNTAKDMHDTYKKMDRLFMPDMYKLNSLSDDDKQKKLNELTEYKSMLWSYMMDYKDRDQRAKALDGELTATLGGIVNMNQLMEDKFTKPEMNDLYRQYVATATELALNREAGDGRNANLPGPTKSGYIPTEHTKKLETIMSRIKAKLSEAAKGNIPSMLSMEEYQGMDKKDFVENYLFNLDKSLTPAFRNPVIKAALGTQDTSELISKVHDLASLHRERRQAVYAYNQLSSAVKSGRFMDRFVDNPDYDPTQPETIKDAKGKEIPNPDYKPARIPSEDMLQYDGYKKSDDERKNYYKETREKDAENQRQMAEFEKEINDSISEDPNSTTNKEYQNKIKEHTFGSPEVKVPLRNMSDRDLSISYELAHRNMDTVSRNGEFDTSTPEARMNYDKAKFINVTARMRAVEMEIDRRQAEKDAKILAGAKQLIAYVKANKIAINNLVKGFTINDRIVNEEVIHKALELLNKEQAEKERIAEEKRLAKQAKENAGAAPAAGVSTEDKIITDDIWKKFMTTGKYDGEDRLVIHEAITDKIIKGEDLTDREYSYYKLYQKQIDKKLDIKKSTKRPKTPKPKNNKQEQAEPSPTITVDEDIPGEALRSVESENKKTEYTGEPGFFKLRRQDVKYDWENKENEYDEDGNVIPNMFRNFDVFGNVRSPLNLSNNPVIRFKMTEGVGNPEGSIHIEASPDGGKIFEWTGYYLQGFNDKDGNPIKKPDNFTQERWDIYNKALAAVRKEVKEKGFALADVKGGVSFGKLIQNKRGDNGKSQRMGLQQAMGKAPFNDITNQYSVFFGVINDDSSTETQVVVPSPGATTGELINVNDVAGLSVPQPMLNAIGSLRKRTAGQVVALLPTGQRDDSGTQIRFPVILNGSRLSKHTSKAYNIGSGLNKGSEANMGEVLVDALLNPYKEEHLDTIRGMFEMVNMEYHGLDDPKTDWKEFYSPENINTILNKVFFASGLRTKNADYHLPFNFEAIERGTEDGEKSIAIRIGISDNLIKEENRKEVDVFVLGRDGKVIRPLDSAAGSDFVQHRIDDELKYRKENNMEDKGAITYEEIQSTIKQKAFRTPIEELGDKPKPYKGFVFDENGKMIVKNFTSYIEYSDQLDILGSNIQSLSNDRGQQQFFINQEAYFAPKENVLPPKKDTKPAAPKVKPVPPVTKATADFASIDARERASMKSIADDGFGWYASTDDPGGVIEASTKAKLIVKIQDKYEEERTLLKNQLVKGAPSPTAIVTGNTGNPFLADTVLKDPPGAAASVSEKASPLSASNKSMRKRRPMLAAPNNEILTAPEILKELGKKEITDADVVNMIKNKEVVKDCS